MPKQAKTASTGEMELKNEKFKNASDAQLLQATKKNRQNIVEFDPDKSKCSLRHQQLG